MPIGEEDLPTPAFTSSAPRVNGADRRARVFQGGFYRDLHRMLGVASGTEVDILMWWKYSSRHRAEMKAAC